MRLRTVAALLALLLPAVVHARGVKKAAGPRAPLVGVLPLKVLGLAESEAAALQAELIREVRRVRGFRVLSAGAVDRALGRLPAGARTPLAELVPALRSRWVLTGTLAGLGEERGLDLKLLDGKTALEARRASAALPGDPAARKAVLEELVAELLTPERWVGALELEVSEEGAEVWLDGQAVARSPLSAPLTGLVPGKHILMIRKEGFGEFSKFVVIRYDQTARLKVDLASAAVVGLIYDRRALEPPPGPLTAEQVAPPAPGPGWKLAAGYSLLALGGASLVAGGLLTWHVDDLERRIDVRLWTADQARELEAALDEGRRLRRTSTGLMAGGGGLILLSGALFLWHLLAVDAEPAALEVTATAGPGGVGLGLQGRF
jgi:hypothetical protein